MYKSAGLLLLLVGAIAAAELRGDDGHYSRQKRQIPEPNFPTFGPDVERTADGVPILDESYLESKDRPAARFFAQFEPTEKEGLRLYESLVGGSSSGRPGLRSLDGVDPFAEEANGLQSGSHSSSWTRKTSSRRTSRKSIQVKSAGSTGTTTRDLSSGLGSSVEPHFSEEVNYQRTSNANKRRNAQLRSLNTNGGNDGYSCVTCRRHLGSGERPGVTELKTLTRSTTTNAQGHETEGLRLYKKLLRNGGSRNQLRSLDNDDDLPQNGILPHHRKSAAWSEKEESHQSYSQNQSSVQVRSGNTPSETPSGFGPSTGPQFSDEVNYRRSNSGRRSHTRNASRTRSLSSSSSQSNSQSTGGSNCVTCQTRSASSSSLVDESPVTYHRSSRVPSTGDYLIPTPAASASSSWAEREERSHFRSRTVSRKINGVETNGLGEPLHSEEEANYRRVAASGSNNGAATTTRRNLRTGARSLSNTEQSSIHAAAQQHLASEHSSAAEHSESEHSSSSSSSTTNNVHRAPARTLSVAGLNTNGNGRSRRYNCSRISTTSLSEGAQSVTEIVTPPPCLVRRSSSSNDNQLSTRASTRSLDLAYPPIQTFGRGDQEVQARVLTDNENGFNQHQQQQQQLHSSSSASEHSESENHEESNSAYAQPTVASYRTGRKHKKAFYRRTVFKNYTTSEYPASLETWLGA